MAKYTKIGAIIGVLCLAGAVLSLVLVVVAPAILQGLSPGPLPTSSSPNSVGGALSNLENGIKGLLPILAMLLIMLMLVAPVLGVLADAVTGGFKRKEPAPPVQGAQEKQ